MYLNRTIFEIETALESKVKIGFVIRAKDQTAKPKAKAESTNPEQLASDDWKVLDIGNWKQYLPALSLPTSIESPFRA